MNLISVLRETTLCLRSEHFSRHPKQFRMCSSRRGSREWSARCPHLMCPILNCSRYPTHLDLRSSNWRSYSAKMADSIAPRIFPLICTMSNHVCLPFRAGNITRAGLPSMWRTKKPRIVIVPSSASTMVTSANALTGLFSFVDTLTSTEIDPTFVVIVPSDRCTRATFIAYELALKRDKLFVNCVTQKRAFCERKCE
jgi:hypothetical protein